MKKISLLFALLMVLCSMSFAAFAADASEEIDGGEFDTGLKWSLSADGTMTISGTGAMKDRDQYTNNAQGQSVLFRPWNDVLDQIKILVIEEGITRVGGQTFMGAVNLKSVVIADSVTEIGFRAFGSCKSLTDITFGSGLRIMKQEVFIRCESLTEMVIPDTVTEVGNHLLAYCTSLTDVTFSRNMTKIADGMFKGDIGLRRIVIPEGITIIQSDAFYGCEKLSEIVLPSTLTSIKTQAFFNCISLTSIDLPEGLESMGNCVFQGCPYLRSVTIPASVTSLAHTFDSCYGLKSVTFLGHPPTMSSDTFGSVTITAYYPNNFGTWTDSILQNYGGTVTWKGYEAELPGGDIAGGPLGRNLTWRLTDTYSLVISGTGTMFSDSPWSGYGDRIQSIVVEPGVTSVATYAFDDCVAATSAEIADTVTHLGWQCFHGCSKLESVKIGSGVTTIDNRAFWNCDSLQTIVIPDNVQEIAEFAFDGCDNLKQVVLPVGLTEISRCLFANCTGLESIVIPAAVETVGDEAFSRCTSLKEITFLGNAPQFNYGVFDNVTATVYYPAGDATWTEAVRQNYGGAITWVADCKNHDYAAVVAEPTCTEKGITVHTCSICGDRYETDEVPALGHTGTYKVDTAPSLEAEGSLAGTCDRCGEDLKIVLPKLSKQNYSLEVLVEPTKEAEGFGKYTWNVTDYGEFTFEAAISNVILGDVNDDGGVTILDLMRLANHFAKNAEINEANADVNNDGKVTILDLMRLANYFAGKATLG